MDSFNMLSNQLTALQNADNNSYNRFRQTQADATAASDKNLERDLSTLGQYSQNYAKEINNRKATPDKSDDYLIPYLETARNDKVNAQNAASATSAEKAAADAQKQSNWEKEYKLDAANTYSTIANRGASGSTTSKDITTMGTPEQLSLFSGMMDTFAGNGVSQTYKGTDGIQKAATYVALHEVDLTQKLGKPLYDRMLAQLKSADTITGQPKTDTTSETKYSYKTDPEFVSNLAGVNANPATAVQDVTNNAAQLIEDYTYDGYKELLARAKAIQSGSSTDGITLGKP
jgi:hypothetical protein